MDRRESSSVRGNKVVVIGGGVAGSLLAKSLQFHSHVTLIDPKEYFEMPWGSLRAKVEPSFGERMMINHREYLTNAHIVISNATNITKTQVITDDGRQIDYDYLVIATGHADSFPKRKTERLDQFRQEFDKIKSAKSILIIGGGPTGVELAGEIASDFPSKKVTLVHKGPRLLDFIGPKAADKTLSWLKSKKVDVKLEQSVNLSAIKEGSKEYQTSLGEKIEADCHFLCTSRNSGSAWLEKTELKNELDVLGRLKVDQYLRVCGRPNIFAIGDISDVPEIKQGFCAQKQATLVVRNLKVLIEGGKEGSMGTYTPLPPVAIVSLGRKEAVAQLPGLTVIGRVPGLIKSGDLFVGKTRKQMGV
ncbi:apoptosis-inducing factor-like protein A-like [Senna tora]|uniref:Apoptosis-inducing factor-like protein A-like n=1 Tax=Senna tora TaxID=362788 RepID=A0A834W1G4_9FABA|nr:apoptosis-inducing factor-like protein A-like [Senna tora]